MRATIVQVLRLVSGSGSQMLSARPWQLRSLLIAGVGV